MYNYQRDKYMKNKIIIKVTENGPMERRAEMDHHKVSKIQ